MRLHTNLPEDTIRVAATVAGVRIIKCNEHRSMSRDRAFEVSLSGSSSHRTMNNEDYAATWDEWGIFLAYLFRRDSTMVCKGGGAYESAEHFHWVTGGRFKSLNHGTQHRRHKWDLAGKSLTGSYWAHECACGAIFRRLDLAGHKSFTEWQKAS